MSVPQLRPYQLDAIHRVFKAYANGDRRTAGVAATGAGKTVILANLINRYRSEIDPRPVLVLAHRAELLDQAAEKLRAEMPGTRVGYIQAGRNHVTAPVIVGSVQTLAPKETPASRRRWAALPSFGLIVVDECHRSMGKDYQRTLAALGCLAPEGPRTLGVTATFTREDKARLTDFWQSVAFSIDILDLIDWGYLVPPKFHRVLVEGLDLSHVRTSMRDGVTDLSSEELATAMLRAGAPGVVAQAYARHAEGRQGIVFCPNVVSADQVTQALIGLGFTAATVSGTTSKSERTRIVREYKAGRLQVVSNCSVLGEGFDAPSTKCVVIARPTLSKILFRQQVGRGLRPAPETGFHDCLVLDLVGSTGRNNLATLDDITGNRIHVEEGETLTQARDRQQAAPRAEVLGDTAITGSLDLVAVDPWEAERRSKLTRREREAEDEQDSPELEPDDTEPETRIRYRPVEFREGWFLCSHRGRWFVPITTKGRKQHGVVAIIPTGAAWLVIVAFVGPGAQLDRAFARREDAAVRAVELTLNLVTEGADRAQSDPDAAWRRRKAGWRKRAQAEEFGADLDEVLYAGQAADFIQRVTHGRIVDALQV